MQQEPLYTVLYWDGGYAVGKWRQTIVTSFQKAKELYNQVMQMGYIARIISVDTLKQNGFPNPLERSEFI